MQQIYADLFNSPDIKQQQVDLDQFNIVFADLEEVLAGKYPDIHASHMVVQYILLLERERVGMYQQYLLKIHQFLKGCAIDFTQDNIEVLKCMLQAPLLAEIESLRTKMQSSDLSPGVRYQLRYKDQLLCRRLNMLRGHIISSDGITFLPDQITFGSLFPPINSHDLGSVSVPVL